jgi:hypothetical protein
MDELRILKKTRFVGRTRRSAVPAFLGKFLFRNIVAPLPGPAYFAAAEPADRFERIIIEWSGRLLTTSQGRAITIDKFWRPFK